MTWRRCEGLTENIACEWLYRYARCVPAEQAIVEIGVYRGKSLLALAEGSLAGNRAPVWGIDPWNLDRPSKPKYKSDETFRYATRAIAASPAAELVSPVRAFGSAVALTWSASPGRPPVGLLYVDADHRYEPVLADYRSWAPHLASDAILCWDDYHSDFPGVIQAVNELYALGEISKPRLAPGCSRLAVARWSR